MGVLTTSDPGGYRLYRHFLGILGQPASDRGQYIILDAPRSQKSQKLLINHFQYSSCERERKANRQYDISGNQ